MAAAEQAKSLREFSYTGAPSSSTICIELRAGCARLSRCLKNKGFCTISIDHSKNRHQAQHPTINLDLASGDCFVQLLSLLESQGTVVYIHAAPPCGTCSRARNRRIAFHLRTQGAPDPKPLRSERWPQGLPELLGLDAKRVATANAIYQNVCKIVKHFASSALITIENPSRSYMWLTSWFQSLIAECNLTPVHLQQCTHGGQKWSCFYVAVPRASLDL